ncbi:hypothetical protein FPQ18DRAFT_329581 [Pyronema domesticum]|nr:hypothetical protein FPQ18DRAFT_329581 [Pyronema domesticum]
MHSHAIAEIGYRKRNGGQVCDMCGLWENSCAPERYCEDTKSDSYGGITFGPAIGTGRMTIGQLCTDCIMMQTCSSCNKFYCHNCVFSQEDNVNPLMANIVPHEYVTHMRMKCDLHLPECDECLDRGIDSDEDDDTSEGLPGRGDIVSGLFECDECCDGICLKCEAPFGTKTLTDAFGGMGLREALAHTKVHSDIEFKMMAEIPFHKTDYRHLKALKGVHELASITTIRLFEKCQGCFTELCMDCIRKDRREIKHYTGPFKHPLNFSWYEVCIVCQARYCGECTLKYMNDCKSCDVWICDECDMREVYSTPVFLFDDCHGGKCPDLVYSDLEGCWEETGEDGKIVSWDGTVKERYREEEVGTAQPVGTFEQDVSSWPGQTAPVHLTDFIPDEDDYDEDNEEDNEEHNEEE